LVAAAPHSKLQRLVQTEGKLTSKFINIDSGSPSKTALNGGVFMLAVTLPAKTLCVHIDDQKSKPLLMH
jgi:hypothetical protein